MKKDHWWNARANEKDLDELAKLGKQTKLSSSMSMWLAVRFCRENIELFKMWIENRDA